MGKFKKAILIMMYSGLLFLLLFSVLVGLVTIVTEGMLVILFLNCMFVSIITVLLYPCIKKIIKK